MAVHGLAREDAVWEYLQSGEPTAGRCDIQKRLVGPVGGLRADELSEARDLPIAEFIGNGQYREKVALFSSPGPACRAGPSRTARPFEVRVSESPPGGARLIDGAGVI